MIFLERGGRGGEDMIDFHCIIYTIVMVCLLSLQGLNTNVNLTPEEYDVEFKALQYALFSCCFAQVGYY